MFSNFTKSDKFGKPSPIPPKRTPTIYDRRQSKNALTQTQTETRPISVFACCKIKRWLYFLSVKTFRKVQVKKKKKKLWRPLQTIIFSPSDSCVMYNKKDVSHSDGCDSPVEFRARGHYYKMFKKYCCTVLRLDLTIILVFSFFFFHFYHENACFNLSSIIITYWKC